MESEIATKFVQKFSPKDPEHVLWLRQMSLMMEKLGQKMDLVTAVNTNPMKLKLTTPLDWVFIHFSLALAYTKAVFKGEAFIPTPK